MPMVGMAIHSVSLYALIFMCFLIIEYQCFAQLVHYLLTDGLLDSFRFGLVGVLEGAMVPVADAPLDGIFEYRVDPDPDLRLLVHGSCGSSGASLEFQ